MNNKLSLTLILTPLLLAMWLTNCAPDAHAQIRAEWHHIYGTETMESVYVLETDGRRLYAATSEGVLHLAWITVTPGVMPSLPTAANTFILLQLESVGRMPCMQGHIFRRRIPLRQSRQHLARPKDNGIRIFDLDRS